MSSPEISIAIISRNEEKNIGKVLADIFETTHKAGMGTYELYLVDGYSNDSTVEVANSFNIKTFMVQGGKGNGIKKAVELANGEFILFIDADCSHIPQDMPHLVEAIKNNKADMVVASRILGGSEELNGRNFDSFLRLCGNKLSTFIVNLRWGTKLTDIQNGFRIIKRGIALELNLKESGFSIEQEMVMKCLKKNKKIIEIPSRELKRLYGSSKVCKKEFWKYLWSMLRNL